VERLFGNFFDELFEGHGKTLPEISDLVNIFFAYPHFYLYIIGKRFIIPLKSRFGRKAMKNKCPYCGGLKDRRGRYRHRDFCRLLEAGRKICERCRGRGRWHHPDCPAVREVRA
jgi:hypothetical protein